MKGTLELTPDMLAQLVCGVLETNGYKADGLAIFNGDQLIGYDRAVIHLSFTQGVEIFPRPKSAAQSREELDRTINPYVPPTTFGRRNGAGQPDGVGAEQAGS